MNDPEQDLHDLFEVSVMKIRLNFKKNRVMLVHFCIDMGLRSLCYLTSKLKTRWQ